MTAETAPTVQIIEFLHPGGEYKPKSRGQDPHVIWDNDPQRLSGIRRWNCLQNHKRKFMRSNGTYVNDIASPTQDGQFAFWGEWEAQSTFRLTGRKRHESPYCVHEPILDLNSTDERKHNTDPYVFGDYFWYTNCRQNRNGVLTRLAPYSLVLFGSRKGSKGNRNFYLDTVFIVGKAFQNPVPDHLIDEASEQLKCANFCHDNLSRSSEKSYLIFYKGLMKKESPRFFSFVPGKPFAGSEPQPHERPVLAPYDDFGLRRGQTMGCARLFRGKQINGTLPETFVREYWAKIAGHCIAQGFSLITSIKEPKIDK